MKNTFIVIATLFVVLLLAYTFVGFWEPSRYQQWKNRNNMKCTNRNNIKICTNNKGETFIDGVKSNQNIHITHADGSVC